MKQIFKIQGSAAEPYEVKLEKIGMHIRATCTCPAGENGQYCKHRIGLLHGVVDGLVEGNIAAIAGWLDGSDMKKFLQEINILEKQAEKIKAEITAKKKNLARLMHT